MPKKKEAKPWTREEIAAQTAEFEARGGIITQVEPGVSGDSKIPSQWRNKRREFEDRRKRQAWMKELLM